MNWDAMKVKADELLVSGTDLDATEINEIKQYIEDCRNYEAGIVRPMGGTPVDPPPPPPMPPGRCDGLVPSRLAGIATFIEDWITTVRTRIDEAG